MAAEQLRASLPALGFGPPDPTGPACPAIVVTPTEPLSTLPASFTADYVNGNWDLCDGRVRSNAFVAGGVVWALSIVPDSVKVQCRCKKWHFVCMAKNLIYNPCTDGMLHLAPASGGWQWSGGDWVAAEAQLVGGPSRANLTTRSLQLDLSPLFDDDLEGLHGTALTVKAVWPHWASDTRDARVGRAVAVAVRGALLLDWLPTQVKPPPPPAPSPPPPPPSQPPQSPQSPESLSEGYTPPQLIDAVGTPLLHRRALLRKGTTPLGHAPQSALRTVRAAGPAMLGIHYSPDAGAYPYGTLVTPNTTYVYPIATDEDLLWMAADALALGAASGLPAELPLGPAACRQFRRAAAAVTGREVSELSRAEDAVLAAVRDAAAKQEPGRRLVLAARIDPAHLPSPPPPPPPPPPPSPPSSGVPPLMTAAAAMLAALCLAVGFVLLIQRKTLAQKPSARTPSLRQPLLQEHPDGPSSPPPVLTPREPKQSGAAGGTSAEGRGDCCVCMAARATQGFVHEGAIHVCVCGDCEEDLRARGQLACPVCRQPFSSVKMAVST